MRATFRPVLRAVRATFTYTKPLVMAPGGTPRELNRIDIKNWTPTPEPLSARIALHLRELAEKVEHTRIFARSVSDHRSAQACPSFCHARASWPQFSDDKKTPAGEAGVLRSG